MAEAYTILFVEDDTGVRASTAELLATNGFKMLVAEDGEEALRLLAENRVDALVTDIVMPGLDGISLARRAMLSQPDIKVLFITGYYSRAAEANRIAEILFKPVRETKITDAIRRLLRSTC